MKNTILFLVFLFCILSCNNKEKYQGQWTNWYLKNSGFNEIRNVIIKNDSITFNYPYFDNSNKYALKIENNKFKFNNLTLKASIEKDTLTLSDSIYFVKDDIDSLYGSKILLKIDLPEILELENNYRYNDDLNTYVFYGKKLENNEFSLQLNDKYAKTNEIPAFVGYERTSVRYEEIPFYSTFLFIDKTTPMKFIEDVFYNLSIVNQLKISFINNINLEYNDSLGLYYEYEKLTKRLPPFRENDYYNTNTSSNEYSIPPPPPLSPPLFDNTNSTTRFLLLKKGNIYFNNEILSSKDLKTLMRPWIENNDVIFSLFDLESNYSGFLKMNAIINNAYEEVRENHSKLTFNKTLKELTREEYNEIKMKIRMYHIWSYSVPHYNSIIEHNNSFFGLKVKPIN